jgi:hypothetical protein
LRGSLRVFCRGRAEAEASDPADEIAEARGLRSGSKKKNVEATLILLASQRSEIVNTSSRSVPDRREAVAVRFAFTRRTIMFRLIHLSIVGTAVLSVAVAAPLPKQAAKPGGILVLDDCDEQYQGKVEYRDNLTLLDSAGKQLFRVSGFNNCESIGSSRMVAADPTRKCIWVVENVAQRIRRFDLAGKETLALAGVHGSALAVDPQTGNVWALVGEGQIGRGKTVVYDSKGKKVASYDISGWDIAYDRKAKAFWIAERKLTKITAKGEVVFSANISTWCASSVDVDPRTGAAWVTVRQHPQVAGSSNRLLKFDPSGKELAAIELGRKGPFRVSVDPKNESVWVAHFRKSVERFAADGKSEVEHPVEALAVQVDPAGGDVWVVTPTEVQKITPRGRVMRRAMHAGKTSQAWIASLE